MLLLLHIHPIMRTSGTLLGFFYGNNNFLKYCIAVLWQSKLDRTITLYHVMYLFYFIFCYFTAPVLCLFWLSKHAVGSVLLSAPEVVRGAHGGSVTVSCQYDSKFRENTKYWCKGRIYELCTIVVKTPKNRHSTRSFIADDKNTGVFTVTMISLKESDEDIYWCVISRHGRNVYTAVMLYISHTGITRLHQTH